MTTRISIYLLMALLLTPAIALAKPDVSVVLQAEKEVRVVENGETVTKKAPADNAYPGDILIYTLIYSNKGDETATGVKFNSPIPEETIYIDGSAKTDAAEIFFSVDGGKSYAEADKLEVIKTDATGKQVTRPATTKDFNSIRWLLQQLQAGESGEFTYRVQVK